MSQQLTQSTTEPLVVAIAARALFDLEKENDIYEKSGLDAYRDYQLKNESRILEIGTAFHLVSGLLKFNFNSPGEAKKVVTVVVMSSNSPDLSPRVFKSIEKYNLEIDQAVFSSGASIDPYLRSFGVDLFLSRSETEVRSAISNGIAAAKLYSPPEGFTPDDEEIRIAFDGDAVLFSAEAENIYQKHGINAFIEHEKNNSKKVLQAGPFAKLLTTLVTLKKNNFGSERKIKLALVTARSVATHERVIRTFRNWNVHIDQAFFLGGMPKDRILEEFRPHIFFDDQAVHALPASRVAPSGKVPVIKAE